MHRSRVYIHWIWLLFLVSFGLDLVSSLLVARSVEQIVAVGHVDRLFETNPNLLPNETRLAAYLIPILPYIFLATALTGLVSWNFSRLAQSKNGRFDVYVFALGMLTISLTKGIAAFGNFSLLLFGDSPFHILRRLIEFRLGNPIPRGVIYYLDAGIMLVLSFLVATFFLKWRPIFSPNSERNSENVPPRSL